MASVTVFLCTFKVVAPFLIEIWRVKHSTTASSNAVIFSGIGYTKYTQQGAFCLVWRCSACFGDFFLGLVKLLMNAVAATFARRTCHIKKIKGQFLVTIVGKKNQKLP